MATHKAPKTLGPFVESLRMGDPTGHRNLTLVPLRGERHGQLDYLLSADAFASGVLTVTEVNEGGIVADLLAANQAEQMVLLLDGEELVGAKQNRILNTSVLLPAGSKTRIPVSCVEQGRWRYLSAAFSAGGYSPSTLRARKTRDVSRSLAAVGEARADQSAVWEEVSHQVRSAAAASPTMAMHDVVEQRQEAIGAYIAALPYPHDLRVMSGFRGLPANS